MAKTNRKKGGASRKGDDICNQAGRLAGDLARQVYKVKKKVEAQLNDLSKSVYKVTKKLMEEDTPICKAISRKRKVWQEEKKRHALLAQLGSEIARRQGKNAQKVLSQGRAKHLMDRIRETEQALEGLKKAA